MPTLPPPSMRYGCAERERRKTSAWRPFPPLHTFISQAKSIACYVTALVTHLVVGLLLVNTVVAETCGPQDSELLITPSAISSGLDLPSIFDCENGSFTATWIGAVSMTDSIHIGHGTSVTIVGSYSNSSSRIESVTTSSGGDSDSSPDTDAIDSAAVAETAFGPIFVVENGELVLDGIAVRGGNASSSVGNEETHGGGVHANGATLTVKRCVFEDNFAEESGGAIRASESRVIVQDTVFRRCSAGITAQPVIESAVGAGGGIEVKNTAILVDNCLFEDGFAGAKGGALVQDVGNITVLNSTFYNNSVGSRGTAEGEGGALVLGGCHRDFEGAGPCSVINSTFVLNHAAHAGGTAHVRNADDPSYVEFHDCVIVNSTAGEINVKDDQGEGGAFSVGEGSTLVLMNTTVRGCSAAKQGGAIRLASGDDWEEPGGAVVLRSSTFESNQAHQESGGVIYSNTYSEIRVVGDTNRFAGSRCSTYGAVFRATSNTRIVIEGGKFIDNYSFETGGVLYSKGHVLVTGGQFLHNVAEDRGGVLVSGGEGNFTIQGGTFQGNDGGSEGGVLFVTMNSTMFIEGGIFERNAANEGGVVSVEEDAHLKISNGTFRYNQADFGGFIYKEGAGLTSCKGSTIFGHQARDGGAVYALEANVSWECDLENNNANIGSAIYAVDGTNMTLRGATLYDNGRSRSIAVSMIASTIRMYQVEFHHSATSTSVTAVQIDGNSTFEAESTSFSGFDDQVMVFSEGNLVLDNCDFSASSASVLVQAEGTNSTTVRNALLGDMNFARFIAAADEFGTTPTADSLANVDFTCDGGVADGKTMPPPCSEGSACAVGDVGVYCQCYSRVSGEETCLDNQAGRLSLSVVTSPEITFPPHVLEGDLLLELLSDHFQTTSTNSSTSNRMDGTGVVWNVSALSSGTSAPWTIFPSTGLLLPGQSINLRVTNSPSDDFDGTTNITFGVDGMGISADRESSQRASFAEVSMTVTYFHCPAGKFWNSTYCQLCTDADMNGDEGLICSVPGVSTKTLPVTAGYWRANLSDTSIRECFNYAACKGGSNVEDVNEYCSRGYKGPYCAVCSAGYGQGVGNECHLCTGHFKRAMYSLAALATLITFMLTVVVVIYLVGGQGAVRSTKQRTREILGTVGRGRDGAHRGGVDSFSIMVRETATNNDKRHALEEQRPSWEVGAFHDPSSVKTFVKSERDGGTAVPSHLVKPVSEERGNRGLPTSPTATRINGIVGVSPRGGIVSPRGGMQSSQQHYEQPRHNRALAVGDMKNNSTRRRIRIAATAPTGENKDLDDGAPAIARHGKAPGEAGKRTSVTDRIIDLWSKLPLSKLKIVIVIWQILGAFSETTQATFPPIYQKFLSTIGIFTLDVGHFLSAGCIGTGFDFYDKLKVVTIGPAVILCLLGVTFFMGSRYRRRRRGRSLHEESEVPAHSRRRKGSISPVSLGITRPPSRVTKVPEEHAAGVDTDPTTRPLPDLKTRNQVRKPTEALHSAIVRHGGGGGSDGFVVPPPGRGGGKGVTSAENLGQSRLFSRHTTVALVVLYLVYSQVSTVVFQTFACQDLPEVGRRYLRADFRLECDTPTHRAHKLYAVFCILVYPLGIPAAFCFFLVRQRSRINPHIDNPANMGEEYILREKIEQRQSDETVAPTAFLWGAYYPNRYYYEVCECIRRLMKTGLLVMTLPDSPGQLAISCIFAFLSLQAFEALKPHIDRVDMQLYRTGCWVIFFSNFLALMIEVGIADAASRTSAIFSVMLILVNVLLFLSIWCNTGASVRYLLSSNAVQEALLGFELSRRHVSMSGRGPGKGVENYTDSSEDEEKEVVPALAMTSSTRTLV